MYEISPNDLIKGSNQEDYENEGDINIDENKGHLFVREKQNYENMTKNQIKQRSAEIISSSILIFIIAIAFAGIGTSVMMWNPVVVGCTFLVIVGLGVVRIVKHYMSVPKFDRTKEEIKQDKILAWHIT